MTTRNLRSILSMLSTFSLFILLASDALAANTYKIEPTLSAVIFRIRAGQFGYIYGRFRVLSGVFAIDQKEPAKSHVEVQVKAASVDTINEQRDEELRSPEFLNAEEFPLITFKSKEIKQLDADTYEVMGDLSLLGVTKPLTVKLTHTSTAKGLAGFETQFMIKRSDFGMKHRLGIDDPIMDIGDTVKLTVSLVGIRKESD